MILWTRCNNNNKMKKKQQKHSFFVFLFQSCDAADLIHEAAQRRADHLKFIDAAATDQMRSRNLPFVFQRIVLSLSKDCVGNLQVM